MNYFPHNIGDFSIATQYLTDEELGIYVRLRDHYLSTEKPLQCDWIAIAMRTHCEESVNNVLALMFEQGEGFWFSSSLDEMIANYQEKAEKASKSAKARWKTSKSDADANKPQCENDANAMRTHTERNANAMLTNNHKPITNNQESIKKNTKKKVVRPVDVSEQVWEDFSAIRKQRKAPLTETALNGIRTEAEKASMTLENALLMACSRGWQSFKAEWVEGGSSTNTATQHNGATVSKWGAKSIEPDWSTVDYGETGKLV